MSTTTSQQNRFFSIKTELLKIGDIVRMHAVGGDAATDFDLCTGMVERTDRNLLVLNLITRPKNRNVLVGTNINFTISNSGWNYELIAGEWDF